MLKEISIVIPVYKEKKEVLKETVNDILNSLSKIEKLDFEIIIVNDGTKDVDYNIFENKKIKIINHPKNKGYGSALKTGISNSNFSYIGITDADGTYPNSMFDKLIREMKDYDMIIGARPWKQISLIRRFPKYVLTQLASFLAGDKIVDLNSGMRIFRKDYCYQFWHLYPKGFSFTSTITMGFLTSGYDVNFFPIKYEKREGKSHIKPIRDTIRFFTLVSRLTLYFNPIKFFFPLSLIFLLLAILRGFRDYFLEGFLGGLTLVLFFMAFQIFFFGLIAEIINKKKF